MNLILIATLPLLLTEYGFQSRDRILTGFDEKWALRRTLLRMSLWFLVFIAAFRAPAGLFVVGLGFVIGEITAVVLRRRFRIDTQKGISHGFPATHLIPFAAGILFFAFFQPIQQANPERFFATRIEIGSLAVIALFSVTALWGWATIVTVSVVDLVRPDQVTEDSGRVGAGEVIGVLERLATFVLVASGAFTAVGFVIAAKAAARFPLFKEKAFAEYFLIGTLTSVGMALVLGLIVATAL